MSEANLKARIQKLQSLIASAGLDAIVLNPGASLRYLTGLEFHLMERPVVFLVDAAGQMYLILPQLESGKLHDLALEVKSERYGDDPAEWQTAFDNALAHLAPKKLRVGVEPTKLRFLELNYLQKALPNAEFVDASGVFAGLRMVKDAVELSKMRRAAQIAEAALLSTIATIQPGQTEKEIAAALLVELYRHGSDQELPFPPIVCSGPNTANPHASPSERKVEEGDLILFDWGAGFEGYFSDITRCFFLGKVNQALLEIAETVQRANHYAVAEIKPGMAAGEVDAIARQEIEESGFGPYFTHRTGHGLGMEAHEAPYIFGGNGQTLDVGMVFTVEPGIYVPGLGGVRIEDDVVVTPDGFTSLTTLPREVMTIESYLRYYRSLRQWYEAGL